MESVLVAIVVPDETVTMNWLKQSNIPVTTPFKGPKVVVSGLMFFDFRIVRILLLLVLMIELKKKLWMNYIKPRNPSA